MNRLSIAAVGAFTLLGLTDRGLGVHGVNAGDESSVVHGVTMVGWTNLPSQKPNHASQLYAKNVTTFLDHLLTTFFDGSAADVVAALIESKGSDLKPAELAELSKLIDQTREEGR